LSGENSACVLFEKSRVRVSLGKAIASANRAFLKHNELAVTLKGDGVGGKAINTCGERRRQARAITLTLVGDRFKGNL